MLKKAHEVTLMNSKLDMYFFHNPQEQFFGFHSLLTFLKVTALGDYFNS